MSGNQAYIGTSAYDLERLAALPEIAVQEEAEQRARPRPATAPQSERRRVSAKKAARRAARHRVPVFGILGAMVVGTLLLMIVLSHMQLSVISSEMAQLERQMSALRSESAYLQLAHEEAFSQAEVERFAREELGMVDITRGQMVFIGSGISGDVAEILRVDETPSYGLIAHVAGLFETLRESWSSIRGS